MPINAGNNKRTFLRGIEPELRKLGEGVFDSSLDEPTYLSFKIHFGSMINAGSDITGFNNMPAPQNTTGVYTSYDYMPTPFFQLKSPEDYKKENRALASGDVKGSYGTNFLYSTYEYLYNSNQAYRAELLLEFIQGWSELQFQCQYFFTKVDGLSDISNIKPEEGQRLVNKQLTIHFHDSVDQRVKYLLDLYRRIVWDDVYQRWAVPDIMRYFRVYVFVSEARTFHSTTTQYSYGGKDKDTGAKQISGNQTLGNRIWDTVKSGFEYIGDKIKGEAGRAIDTVIDSIPETGIPVIDNFIDRHTGRGSLERKGIDYDIAEVMSAADYVYKTVNHIAPVKVYEFDMCDIDLTSLGSIEENSLSNEQNKMSEDKSFKVNVRNVRLIEHYNILRGVGRWPLSSEYTYTRFKSLDYDPVLNMYLDDEMINRININLQKDNSSIVNPNKAVYDSYIADTSYFTDDMFMTEAEKNHVPYTAYHKNDLSTGIDPSKRGGKIAGNSLWNKLIGSAIKEVFSMGTNWITDKANDILNRKIGSTNLSVNDIFGIFKSGDAMGMVNGIKGAVDGINNPTDNAIGLRGLDRSVIMKGALARIASVKPTDEVGFRNTLVSRELLSPGKKTLFDELISDNVNKEFIDFKLDEVYQEQFDKYKLALEGQRKQWTLENALIDNAIKDSKIELARLIINEKKPIDLMPLGFRSTVPLDQLGELGLFGMDPKDIELAGLPQEAVKPLIKLMGLPQDAVKAVIELLGLPQDAIKNQIELLGLPQDVVKTLIELPYLPQDAVKNIIALMGLPQDVVKVYIELMGLPQDVVKTVIALQGLPQEVVEAVIELQKLPQDVIKNIIGLTGLPQSAIKNIIDLYNIPQEVIENIASLVGLPQDIEEWKEPELVRVPQDTNKTMVDPVVAEHGVFKNKLLNDLELTGEGKMDNDLAVSLVGENKNSEFNLTGPRAVEETDKYNIAAVTLSGDTKNNLRLEDIALRGDQKNTFVPAGIEQRADTKDTTFVNQFELEMFNNQDELRRIMAGTKLQSNSQSENKNNITLQGPSYSAEPNKDFLKDMHVEMDPNNPAKSRLVKKNIYKDEEQASTKEAPTLNEIKKNIYNQR